MVGVALSHGTPMYRLVEAGQVDATRYVQIGLRGYWPGEREFAWQSERGVTSFFQHDVRQLGIETVLARALEIVGARPTFISIDVDVLDPAFAPGTGTPEPGGMTSAELLWACRTAAQRLELVGAEVVEVIPTAIGSADTTALVADRIVREILTGIALRQRERAPLPGDRAALSSPGTTIPGRDWRASAGGQAGISVRADESVAWHDLRAPRPARADDRIANETERDSAATSDFS